MPENDRLSGCLDEINGEFVEREATPRLLVKLGTQLHVCTNQFLRRFPRPSERMAVVRRRYCRRLHRLGSPHREPEAEQRRGLLAALMDRTGAVHIWVYWKPVLRFGLENVSTSRLEGVVASPLLPVVGSLQFVIDLLEGLDIALSRPAKRATGPRRSRGRRRPRGPLPRRRAVARDRDPT